MKKRKYWYFTTIQECVLCGHVDKYRERKYTPKPKDQTKTFSYSQRACQSHF